MSQSQAIGTSGASSAAVINSLNPDQNTSSPRPENENDATVQPRKERTLKSDVWKSFERERKGSNQVIAICRGCKRKFNGSSGSGTTHLRNHRNACHRLRSTQPQISQYTLGASTASEDPTPKLGLSKFDPKIERVLFAKMIAKHDYSFLMAEHGYFRLWIQYCMPTYKIRSRNTVKNDLESVYVEEKARIYKEIENVGSRVSLTTDGWKPQHQNRGYFCVTCHYIDNEWELHKRIISFCIVEYPHHGFHLCEWLKKQVLEWNIDKKLCSVVVDNASNNAGMLDGIKTWLNSKKSLLLDGSMFHLRCAPHIINLIVKKGLGVVHELIERIRKTVKWIAKSLARDEKFELALIQTRFNPKRRIPADVETRWNSTFDMLVNSLELRDAIERLADLEPEYKLLPSNEEWEKGKNICECLKFFSDLTKQLSGTKYPTANFLFLAVHQIRVKLLEWRLSNDDYICLMAMEMQDKFDKYWDECSMALTVAIILDPRYKMQMVEYVYKQFYGELAGVCVDKVRMFLVKLYSKYDDGQSLFGVRDVSDSSSGHVPFVSNEAQSKSSGLFQFGFKQFVASTGSSVVTQKNDLEQYLEETLFPLNEREALSFDILHWWKHTGPKFPFLVKMARDILAIPTSSIASESSFSKARRVITDTRSSLNSSTMETLMCVKDWVPEISNVFVPIEGGDLINDAMVSELNEENVDDLLL